MEASDELFVKFLNLWYYKEPAESSVSEGMKRFAADCIRMFQYGDDKIFSHPKINEIIMLFKDYGLVDYDKSIMELYFEGRMRTQIELRELFNQPEVSLAMQSLLNVVGGMIKKFTNEAQKQIDKEKDLSAIPELSHKHIFEN